MPCSPKYTVTLIYCMPCCPISKIVVVFANTKWRKLVSCAEQIIMSPDHVRSDVWKHFGFDNTDCKIVDKGKTVCCLFKTHMPALALPQQQI